MVSSCTHNRANAAALAKPLLEAAIVSEDAVVEALETLIYELKVICFCTGVKSVSELRGVRVIGPNQPWISPSTPT